MLTIDSGVVQVAGIRDVHEAELLVESGVQYIGLPLRLVHRPDHLSVDDAVKAVAELSDRAHFFLQTYLESADDILDLIQKLNVNIVQLHGELTFDELQRLRANAPDMEIIKSLVVRGDNLKELLEEMAHTSPVVNAFITDTYDPTTGAIGRTGRAHDWTVSRKIVAYSSLPVILAGGLTADNVREAIEAVDPAGVDVHTGIEGPDGRKSRELTERFLAEARAGFSGEI